MLYYKKSKLLVYVPLLLQFVLAIHNRHYFDEVMPTWLEVRFFETQCSYGMNDHTLQAVYRSVVHCQTALRVHCLVRLHDGG